LDTRFYATAGRGIAPLLADELRALGARRVSRERAGAAFSGNLETAYRACLWSRLANRILLPLARFEAPDGDALYAGARTIAWHEHLGSEHTLAVEATTRASALGHTRYVAQRLKDAVVDSLRERTGRRPSVDLREPDLRLNVHVERDQAVVSLDLSGDSLHRRGYRRAGGGAPLKENLAAAILVRAGWQEVAGAGGTLIDPMCGSGTLLIEGAMMAADTAPGLLRRRFGFERWAGHDAALWRRLRDEAQGRRDAGLTHVPVLIGRDVDATAVEVARTNAALAGLGGCIAFEVGDIGGLRAPGGARRGLVVVNPPYGERMGARERLPGLYRQLGAVLRERLGQWRCAIFTGNPELARHAGLVPARRFELPNGALPCELLCIDPPLGRAAQRPARQSYAPSASRARDHAAPSQDAPVSEMLANRLRKNLRTLGSWARRAGIDCYRLYDADMPEYALAVDLYQSDVLWVHVQEYAAPASVDPARARVRLAEALTTIRHVLEVPPDQLVLKQRRRGRGGSRYGALGHAGHEHEVREAGACLLVNLHDHLDTGLFLDHREVRALIREQARGRAFLNLFSYAGAASVQAALGGASRTLSLDLSAGYLAWAARNLALNGFGPPDHACEQADCLEWLRRPRVDERFGVILLDPPTFSNSKRMRQHFDVQRDHARLIRDAACLLEPDGLLVFSTNARRFRLDEDTFGGLDVEEITRRTLPRDFARGRHAHRCWLVRRA
jgi:23S rRNA (guanine2445-N2)-methyltransferase / 23S rRNA (guanine2069-N7)-methyltransferase